MTTNFMLNDLTRDIDDMVAEYNKFATSTSSQDALHWYCQSTISAKLAIAGMGIIQKIYHDRPNLIDAMAAEAMRMLCILRDIKNSVSDDTEKHDTYAKLYREVRNETVHYVRFCLEVGDKACTNKLATKEEVANYQEWAKEVRSLWVPETIDASEKDFVYKMKEAV